MQMPTASDSSLGQVPMASSSLVTNTETRNTVFAPPLLWQLQVDIVVAIIYVDFPTGGALFNRSSTNSVFRI